MYTLTWGAHNFHSLFVRTSFRDVFPNICPDKYNSNVINSFLNGKLKLHRKMNDPG